MKRGQLDRIPVGYQGIELLQVGHKGKYLKTKQERLLERLRRNRQGDPELQLNDVSGNKEEVIPIEVPSKMQAFKDSENLPACVSEISFHRGNITVVRERPGEEDSDSVQSSWHLESSYESEHEQNYVLQR
jgi:hypothetical protein